MSTEKPNTKIEIAELAGTIPKAEMQDIAEPIRVSWREQAAAFNRAVLFMLALVAVFLLLTEGKLEQFTLGPIVVKNTYLVQVLIPVLVAYLYLDAVVTALRWEYYADLHHSMMEKLSPSLVKSGLDCFMGPRILSVAGAGTMPELWKTIKYGRTTEITLAFTGIFAMGVLPSIFQGFAYWRLTDTHGQNPLTWISLVLSAILMLCALYIWLNFGRDHAKSIGTWLASLRRTADRP